LGNKCKALGECVWAKPSEIGRKKTGKERGRRGLAGWTDTYWAFGPVFREVEQAHRESTEGRRHRLGLGFGS